jgi:hypothetical protein
VRADESLNLELLQSGTGSVGIDAKTGGETPVLGSLGEAIPLVDQQVSKLAYVHNEEVLGTVARNDRPSSEPNVTSQRAWDTRDP